MIRGGRSIFLVGGMGLALLVGAGCASRESPRFGELMSETGRRFELLGRAEKVARWELASFELHEIEEIFEEDLPNAKPPDNTGGVNLSGIEKAFLDTHPAELQAALDAHDHAAFASAFGRAAATCNACHQASGHRFIEIPSEPGAGVPRLDPMP